MNILITGATGLVGKRLVKKLLQENHHVTITTRNADKAKQIFNNQVNVIEWRNYEQLLNLDGQNHFHACVHLMGENIGDKRWSTSQKEQLKDSRIKSAKSLINSIKKHQSTVNTFITSSAIGIYPVNTNQNIDENTPIATGFLADLCRDWENASLDENVVKRHVSIRTSVILDPNEGALKKMLLPYKLGLGGPLGNGKQDMSWIHPEDLVNVIISALLDERYSGAINATSPKPVTNKVYSQTLAKVLGRPHFLITPTFPLKIVFGEMSSIILDSQRVYPKKLENLGFHFQFADIESALKNLLD